MRPHFARSGNLKAITGDLPSRSHPAGIKRHRRQPMAIAHPDFTIGVEEEYLLVDLDSLALSPAPEALMAACEQDLQDQVSPEFLNCQIEIGTRVCHNIGEAREDLKRLRSTVARHAKEHNLAPIAASCHPFSDWRSQTQDRKSTRLNSSHSGESRMP